MVNKIAEFFRAEYQRLVRYVRWLIDDTAERDAEDVVQDVMLSLFDRADFTVPIESLTAYIYQSLRNRVVDLLRKRKRRSISLSDVIRDARYDTVREVERKEIRNRVYQALDSLSEEQKAVIIATEFDDRPFRELSEEWGIPIGTLLARKSRALQKIREKLTGLV